MTKNVLNRKYSSGEVQHLYARVVKFYDLWSWMTERKAIRRAMQIAQVNDGDTILEVGVGTGTVFEEIVKQNLHGLNEGIDLSREMLSSAAFRMRAYTAPNFHLHIANAYHLPFANQSFSLVLSNFMFDLLPEEDFPSILEEFKRVLKPSGRVVITTFAFGSRWYHRFWLWTAHHFPALLAGCRPVALDKYLMDVDLEDIGVEAISQNTFPSAIVWGQKRANE